VKLSASINIFPFFRFQEHGFPIDGKRKTPQEYQKTEDVWTLFGHLLQGGNHERLRTTGHHTREGQKLERSAVANCFFQKGKEGEQVEDIPHVKRTGR